MSGLSDGQRERLAELADVVMPPGAGLPAPSDVDVHGHWIDIALESVPMMLPAMEHALSMPGDPAGVMEELQKDQPDAFIAFTFVVSGAYFMHPLVRQSLGYEGLSVEPNPPLEGEAEYYLEDGLLEPVLARGRIYRPVPGEN